MRARVLEYQAQCEYNSDPNQCRRAPEQVLVLLFADHGLVLVIAFHRAVGLVGGDAVAAVAAMVVV